jgi:hypothetical protein
MPPSRPKGDSARDSSAGRRWPWAIAIGLFLVILVNAAFAYIAIHGADPVVDSYRTEPR